ncbi:MAG: alpha/beta fold hydrolase [Rubrivivax sp.]|nr:alpha/beta fold hydrolase [Rubrivivax sp.]
MSIVESVQVFGPERLLFGVLTTPVSAAAAGPGAVPFVLFNAGVIPRLGPHRMNVKLARALAAQGHPVLRFDLSGHGDSPPASSGGDPQRQGERDLVAALDHLEAATGARRFALIGVCSGAVQAYHVALADPRVAGVLMFDGYWYRSRWSRLVRDVKHFRATSAHKAWRGLVERLRVRIGQPHSAPLTNVYQEDGNPPREAFDRAMAQMSARAAVYVVYSGSVIDYYSYGAQFRHVFGRRPWFKDVRCELMADVDHSFLELRAQRRFIEAVIAWLPAVRQAAAVLR